MTMKFCDFDARKSETASTWFTETATGSHLLKLTGYSFNKGIGKGNCITSDTFTVGGYDWAIQYFPDDASKYGYNALSLKLLSDAEARVKLTFTMHNQTGGTPLIRSSGPETIRANDARSFLEFIERYTFENSQYRKNDSFTVDCTVTVFKRMSLQKTNSKAHLIALQPSDFNQQLAGLLEHGEGKDVSFDVKGVTFDAHRCVLAARSPVFRAQLFGPMKGKMDKSIEIKDMEPTIFKSMLHFIYSDTVPELEKGEGDNDATIALAQHLLVAADRYGLERLKLLCAIKMCDSLDVDNVATTLTLAEQHNCSELKVACMEFIKPPEVLAAVALTEGFRYMIISCPTIQEELR